MTRGSGSGLLFLAAPLAGCFMDASGGAQRGGEAVVLVRDADPETADAAPHDAAQEPVTRDAAIIDAAAESERDASAELDAGEPLAGDAAVGADAGSAAYPALLSQTGLYEAGDPARIAGAVRAFEPRYKLWSDGASKRRWLLLPEGTRIDTEDMDAWQFPVGTKAWKEFSVDGKPVETRMLHKRGEHDWVMVAYRWLPDLRDAEALPEGALDVAGTSHDIPSQALCQRCHGNGGDTLLGVSALQLSHAGEGVTLESLKAAGQLSAAPSGDFVIPGGPVAEQALGYLHANCGHCHNPRSEAYTQILARAPYTGGPILWERTDALGALEDTLGYQSTVGQPNSVLPDLAIIEPGEPALSELFIRIGQRGPGSLQMPPIGTEQVDEVGRAAVKAWIKSLADSAE